METGLTPIALTCNDRTDPIGIDLEQGPPLLAWRPRGVGRSRAQSAARVVASRAHPDGRAEPLWDSGELAVSAPRLTYSGPPLSSEDRVVWTVQVRDESGRLGPWSEQASFRLGLLSSSDWLGSWISHPRVRGANGDPVALPQPAPVLRTEFELGNAAVDARLHVCGLGFHAVDLNGARVGHHALAPVPTVFDRRTLYATHDVTTLLRAGRNALTVTLGTGWFDYHTKDPWGFARASWRDRPKLLLQLVVDQIDGDRVVIASGPSWRAARGPVRFDGIRNGEHVDARMRIHGVSHAGYDDSTWPLAEVVAGPGGRLVAQTVPVVVGDSLPAKSVTHVGDGEFVVDMGQNLAGRLRIQVAGPAGTQIVLRHGERLDTSGRVDTSAISGFTRSGEFQTDRYTLAGDGAESWEPQFTYHGFRYAQVTGWPGRPDPTAFTAQVLHSDMARAGTFRCSDQVLERIFEATRWSFLSNFVGYPSDCPHREKNGWTGDALLASETGLLLYSSAPAYRQWLDSVADLQRPDGSVPGIVPSAGWGYTFPPDNDLAGPAWDSAVIQLPWTIHRFTDDLQLLRRHYDGMVRYLDQLARTAVDGIVSYGLGDWCPPGSFEGHACPETVTSTAFLYSDAVVLSRIAELLGRGNDASAHRALAEQVRQRFQDRFVDRASGWVEGRDITSQSCALNFGLLDGVVAQRSLARLLEAVADVGGHPWAGILGASWAPRVLADHGHADAALAMVTAPGYPGWRHWIDEGATTLWETWDGSTSRNHIMFGDVAAWMMSRLAGIRPDERAPGFARVVVEPSFPDRLTWVEAEHRSPRGPVRAAWRRMDDSLLVEVGIPAGATGQVRLPTRPGEHVTESGVDAADSTGVRRAIRGAGRTVLEIGSGDYEFRVTRIADSAPVS